MSDPDYDFLNNEAPDDVVAAPEPTPAPEPTVEPAAPVAAAPATTAEPVEGTHVPLAALKAEREKRQQYERELAELRKQAAQPQAQPEPANFYEAPEQYVQQAVTQARMQTQQVLYAALEDAARDQYADYDEVLGEVTAAAQENPVIRQQVFASPNPAVAAYKLGKQLREMKAMQDPAAYRQKVEAEVRASIKAEQDAAEKARTAAAAAIPPDLSAARSARDEPVVEDDSLDSILASKKR